MQELDECESIGYVLWEEHFESLLDLVKETVLDG